jgi:hypothetical protein
MSPDRSAQAQPHRQPTPGSADATSVTLQAVLADSRRVGRSRRRLCLVASTLFVGALAAGLMLTVAPRDERTMAALSSSVQLLMSVTVPFLGVLLVQDVARPSRRPALVSSVLAALVVAAMVAVFGIVLCSLATALASPAPDGRWQHAGTVVLGSLLVQVLAQLQGTGLGMLVRRRVLACLLTIVLPLGLWLVLGALDVLRPAQAWVTPFSSAGNLLAGEMSPVRWAQWLVVVGIWGIGLNVLGVSRASRIRRSAQPRPGSAERGTLHRNGPPTSTRTTMT